ncbi:hypothetical protein [Pseudoalteromonas nigrifaciens]|uniref:hypothetical protein n=1 Tax=Pseudoalteromonas nigrifaciens TaxID=28109 RepID=UPI0035638EC6
MPAGLQVFDSNGDAVIDTSTQTTSILGNITINNAGTYSVTDSRFVLGKPFYMANEFYSGVDIVATISGNTYTFIVKRLQYGTYEPFKIIYGVY